GLPELLGAVVAARAYRRTRVMEFDRGGTAALAHARALAGGVTEQDLVELGAAHLVGGRKRLVPGVGEVEGDGLLVPRRDKFSAVFRHGDALDFLRHAERFEQIGRASCRERA